MELLNLSTISDNDCLPRFSVTGANGFNRFHNIEALNDLSKDNMFPVKPRCGNGGEEELRSICVGSCVRHGQHSGTTMPPYEVFIWELNSIYRFSPCSIPLGEVSTLAHELWDDTVECGAFIVEISPTLANPFLTRTQAPAMSRTFVLFTIRPNTYSMG
jgi:hypothetical protein